MNERLLRLYDEVTKNRSVSNEAIHSDDRVLIVDGLNTYIRVFSAVPALNDDGDHVGGVVGFLRSIAALVRQFKPTRCVLVFDGKGGSARRKKVFSNYKANRAVKTKFNRHEEFANIEDEQASMKAQFSRMVEYLQTLPVTLISIDHVEADDVIAYLAQETFAKSERVIISSTDRDFLQLISDRVQVWSPVKKKLYDKRSLQEEYLVHPNNYLTYRTVIGDKSDNIPGVNGVALKTLVKLFPELTEEAQVDVDMLVDKATQIKGKAAITLAEAKTQLDMNWDLMQLKDVDIPANTKLLVHDIAHRPINKMNQLEFKKMFMRDKLYTVIKDVDFWLRDTFLSLTAYSQH
jgi:DNA polymerase I